MAAGLTSAIMSTADVCVRSARASDLLLGHDEWGASWIAAHRARVAAATLQTAAAAVSAEAAGS
jgi:5-methyltetrahydrofolate--homocysteine methyltransferase